jgi:diguanylate cyclase (GGDEF)-like protein
LNPEDPQEEGPNAYERSLPVTQPNLPALQTPEPKNLRRAAWIGGACLLMAGICWVDMVTPASMAFILIYLLPVVATAWWMDAFCAILVALAASLAWTVAHFNTGQLVSPTLLAWNSLSRLVVFVGTGWLIAVLRRQRSHLAAQAAREHQLACSDPLTELPNWRGFETHLRLALARAARENRSMCIGYVDLDNFKRVNDLHGHAIGNDVLQRLGQLLRETVRGQDLVARIGGDEFALVLDAFDVDRVKRVGQRLVDAVAGLGDQLPNSGLGASVGLVLVSNPDGWAQKTEQLLQLADRAMYQAKQAGKGRLVITEI